MAGSKSWRTAESLPAEAAAPILASLAAFVDARLVSGEHVCVGLSGGVDSVVLLHALDCLRLAGKPFELSAVHVHHGLSVHADDWADFCRDFCRSRELALDIVRVAVPRIGGEGLEAAARRARYQAFAGCSADCLALAHHRDDQAETVLFRLLRGTGVAGAAGMRGERPLAGSGPRRLIRPLFEISRAMIERYAEGHGLAWIEDESNADCHYRRNYLRRELMPLIVRRFPGAVQAINRAAGHFAETAELLADLARVDRGAMVGKGGRVQLGGLKTLSPARARNLLRLELLAAGFRAPDARWLDEALRQLTGADERSRMRIETADGALHAYRGELHLVVHRPDVSGLALIWDGTTTALPWGDERVVFVRAAGKGISRRLLGEAQVCLRARRGGERFQPDPRRPVRTLRNLLQEAAVPLWQRARLPLLWAGERLVWVGGFGVDAAFACPPDEEGVQPVWEALDGAAKVLGG